MTEKFARTNGLSLCCSNSSLPLSFGRFDLEMYPLFLINEKFHSAKKRKKEKKKNPVKDFANNFFMNMLSTIKFCQIRIGSYNSG